MGDLAQIILITCILHRIWAIRFFVANMLPGLFAKSGEEYSHRCFSLSILYWKNSFFQVLFFGILFHILKTLLMESGSFMKYMHFKASCSYAALAAIMEIMAVVKEYLHRSIREQIKGGGL